MSSVSNFERDKPKKTYESIKALSNYINSNENHDKKELQKLVENVRLNFLSGS